MGTRKVSILESAATAVAKIAWFIESKGLPHTAKKFVIDSFHFFEKLSDERIEHKPCTYQQWKALGYGALVSKRNMLSLISASKKKLWSVILLLPNCYGEHGYSYLPQYAHQNI